MHKSTLRQDQKMDEKAGTWLDPLEATLEVGKDLVRKAPHLATMAIAELMEATRDLIDQSRLLNSLRGTIPWGGIVDSLQTPLVSALDAAARRKNLKASAALEIPDPGEIAEMMQVLEGFFTDNVIHFVVRLVIPAARPQTLGPMLKGLASHLRNQNVDLTDGASLAIFAEALSQKMKALQVEIPASEIRDAVADSIELSPPEILK